MEIAKHIRDVLQICFIGITGMFGGDMFMILNTAGESIFLKNVFLLLGIAALLVKIFLMIKNNKSEV